MANYKDKKEPKGIVAKVKGWKDDSKEASNTWANKRSKWYRMRMRVKKAKTKPFVGCSNVRMPTLDTIIRKIKASLIQAVFGIRPLVSVIPSPSGDYNKAKKIEKFIDHLLMNVIKIKQKAVIATDRELEGGFFILKPYWETEIAMREKEFKVAELEDEDLEVLYDPETPEEVLLQYFASILEPDLSSKVRKENVAAIQKGVALVLQGEEVVTFKLKDVIKDQPNVALIDPEHCYVPAQSGCDPQDCEYIIHEFFLRPDQVDLRVDNNGWSKEAGKKIEHSKEMVRTNTDIQKDTKEGIDRIEKHNLVKVWECYYRQDGKKRIVTMAPEFDAVFRDIALPFHSYKFPFVKLYYELIDDRWYAHRGVPELTEDIVKEIDTQHMQRIDSQTIRNSPMFLYRAGQMKGKSKQFTFGRGIPVSGMQDLKDIIAPFNATNTNAEYSYKDEQQVLEGKIGELIGVTDYNLQSQINKRQPRSKDEVNLQAQSSQIVFSLDSDLHRECWGNLFNWVWELWCQYGPDEYEFMYFGQDAQAQEGAPQGQESIKIGKEDVQNKYTVVVRANDNNTNPEERQNKANVILQDTYMALQAGLAGPQNVIAARKRAMQEMGIENWEEFIMFEPQQPKPPVQPIVIQMEDLTDMERAQVLSGVGVQPDPQGRAMRGAREEEDRQVENTVKVIKEMDGDKPEPQSK